MKRWILFALCVVVGVQVSAQQMTNHWLEPYTPTRLEWLSVECNELLGRHDKAVHLSFVPQPPNEIKVLVTFTSAAVKTAGERANFIKEAKDAVHSTAKSLGWSDPIAVEAVVVGS